MSSEGHSDTTSSSNTSNAPISTTSTSKTKSLGAALNDDADLGQRNSNFATRCIISDKEFDLLSKLPTSQREGSQSDSAASSDGAEETAFLDSLQSLSAPALCERYAAELAQCRKMLYNNKEYMNALDNFEKYVLGTVDPFEAEALHRSPAGAATSAAEVATSTDKQEVEQPHAKKNTAQQIPSWWGDVKQRFQDICLQNSTTQISGYHSSKL